MRPIPGGALSVKAGGWALLEPHFPGLSASPEHDREDGVTVRSCLRRGRACRLPGALPGPRRSGFPRDVAGAAPTLRPVPAADALARLLTECLAIPRRLDAELVAAIIETVERAACWNW